MRASPAANARNHAAARRMPPAVCSQAVSITNNKALEASFVASVIASSVTPNRRPLPAETMSRIAKSATAIMAGRAGMRWRWVHTCHVKRNNRAPVARSRRLNRKPMRNGKVPNGSSHTIAISPIIAKPGEKATAMLPMSPTSRKSSVNGDKLTAPQPMTAPISTATKRKKLVQTAWAIALLRIKTGR